MNIFVPKNQTQSLSQGKKLTTKLFICSDLSLFWAFLRYKPQNVAWDTNLMHAAWDSLWQQLFLQPGSWTSPCVTVMLSKMLSKPDTAHGELGWLYLHWRPSNMPHKKVSGWKSQKESNVRIRTSEERTFVHIGLLDRVLDLVFLIRTKGGNWRAFKAKE